jgi:hypothetical protein
MLHHAHIDTKGGEPPFAAIANLMGAHFKSGPPTGGHNASHFCTAAARLEPLLTLALVGLVFSQACDTRGVSVLDLWICLMQLGLLPAFRLE